MRFTAPRSAKPCRRRRGKTSRRVGPTGPEGPRSGREIAPVNLWVESKERVGNIGIQTGKELRTALHFFRRDIARHRECTHYEQCTLLRQSGEEADIL